MYKSFDIHYYRLINTTGIDSLQKKIIILLQYHKSKIPKLFKKTKIFSQQIVNSNNIYKISYTLHLASII